MIYFTISCVVLTCFVVLILFWFFYTGLCERKVLCFYCIIIMRVLAVLYRSFFPKHFRLSLPMEFLKR